MQVSQMLGREAARARRSRRRARGPGRRRTPSASPRSPSCPARAAPGGSGSRTAASVFSSRRRTPPPRSRIGTNGLDRKFSSSRTRCARSTDRTVSSLARHRCPEPSTCGCSVRTSRLSRATGIPTLRSCRARRPASSPMPRASQASRISQSTSGLPCWCASVTGSIATSALVVGPAVHAAAMERDVSRQRRELGQRRLVGPDPVLGHAIAHPQRPVRRVALEGAVGAVLRRLHQVHPDVGDRQVVHRRETRLVHDERAIRVGDRHAAEDDRHALVAGLDPRPVAAAFRLPGGSIDCASV